MINKLQSYSFFPKFLKVCKGHLLISVFAILMVGIQCGGGSPSDATTPPSSFDPICTNGIPSTEKVSEASTEKCASCNEGFGLDSEMICKKEVDPICPSGIPSTEKVLGPQQKNALLVIAIMP